MVESDVCFGLNHNIVFCSGLAYTKPSSPGFKQKKGLAYLFSYRLDLLINMPRDEYAFYFLGKFFIKELSLHKST